jgi:hypothetical protein
VGRCAALAASGGRSRRWSCDLTRGIRPGTATERSVLVRFGVALRNSRNDEMARFGSEVPSRSRQSDPHGALTCLAAGSAGASKGIGYRRGLDAPVATNSAEAGSQLTHFDRRPLGCWALGSDRDRFFPRLAIEQEEAADHLFRLREGAVE